MCRMWLPGGVKESLLDDVGCGGGGRLCCLLVSILCNSQILKISCKRNAECGYRRLDEGRGAKKGRKVYIE